MKNTTNIILICLLLGLITFLTIVLIIGIIKPKGFFNFSFSLDDAVIVKEENIDINNIDNINFALVSSDVKIYITDEEKLTLKQYSNKDIEDKYLFSFVKSSDELKIDESSRKFCIGFCFSRSYFELYIPKTYLNDLNISTVSGDINILDNFTLNDIILKTTSGDIKIKNNLIVKDFNFKSVSGDININEIEGKDGSIKTTSGDIEIEALTSYLTASTVSGSVEINRLKGNSNISTTSGDIELDNFLIEKDSDLKTVSGEVSVTLDGNSVCRVETKTVSGNQKITNSTNNGTLLKIKTTSGNIKVK